MMATGDLGRLRHHAGRRDREHEPDGCGGEDGDPWAAPSVVATVWGAVAPLSGAERLSAMRLEGQVTHKITIRYRSGVDSDMRIVMGGRSFNIRAVMDVGERRRYLELLCQEGVAT